MYSVESNPYGSLSSYSSDSAVSPALWTSSVSVMNPVQSGGGMYTSGSGMYSYGGWSPGLSNRFLMPAGDLRDPRNSCRNSGYLHLQDGRSDTFVYTGRNSYQQELLHGGSPHHYQPEQSTNSYEHMYAAAIPPVNSRLGQVQQDSSPRHLTPSSPSRPAMSSRPVSAMTGSAKDGWATAAPTLVSEFLTAHSGGSQWDTLSSVPTLVAGSQRGDSLWDAASSVPTLLRTPSCPRSYSESDSGSSSGSSGSGNYPAGGFTSQVARRLVQFSLQLRSFVWVYVRLICLYMCLYPETYLD